MREEANVFPVSKGWNAAQHSDEMRLMGRDWLKMSTRRKAFWVGRAARYWRKRGFPYSEISESEAAQEIRSLLRSDPKQMFAGDWLRVSMVGLRLANHYHPQMWHVPVHDYRAPFERFHDDWCLRDCIQKSLRFFPNRNSINAQCLRSTLRIYRGTTRVSNFRPTVARALCAQYSEPDERVLDFSAGYGGRLLGCVSLPREYIGIDPCTAQFDGLRAMSRDLRQKLPGIAMIIQGCAEEEMRNFSRNSIDFIMSSPPYYNHERYADEPTQSYIRYPSYSEWRTRFFEAVLAECRRILKPRRVLALNVSTPPGIPLAVDALRICKEGFRLKRTLKMPLYRFPLQRCLTVSAFKTEPIFIFEKI